jgi:hypothetical protein
VRFRLSRRAPRPAAAHNSHFGPRSAPTITPAQRDAIHRQIVDRLGTAGDLSILVEQHDREAARRLAREVANDLQLVLDGLGLGETSSGGDVELGLPPEQLRRTFTCLRERAIEEREAGGQGRGGAQAPYERALIVIETCDQVLAAVGSEGGDV